MNSDDLTVPGLLLSAASIEATVIVFLFRELRRETRARVENAELYLSVLKKQRRKNLSDSEAPPSNSDGRTSRP